MLSVVCVFILARSAGAAWMEGWSHRRVVDLEWVGDRPGDDLAMVDVWTAGHHQPDGTDVRVTADELRIIPSRVLMVGPGDVVRVAFAPVRPVKRYCVYFGNPRPPAPPKGTEELSIRAGLLLEMHSLEAAPPGNFREIERAFSASTRVIGRTIVSRLYLGINPFGDQVSIISRFSGVLNAPTDGSYTFAGSASDRGALFIDGKPVLLIPNLVPDTRFNAKIDLKKGKHDIAFYHVNVAGEQRLSVVWKTPNSANYELIPPEAFGLLHNTTVGGLEQQGKTFAADFRMEYLGECFFSDHYTHRYRFTAVPPKGPAAATARYEWDFGNGQTAGGPAVEQVYLLDGLYPITLTVRMGNQSDAQTTRIAVSRFHAKLDNPPTDLPSQQTAIVSRYDLARLPPTWLPWTTLLFVRTRDVAGIEKAAMALARSDQADGGLTMRALNDASFELLSAGKLDVARRMWQAVPQDSKLQPQAAEAQARVLLWRAADFPAALKLLETHVRQHPKNAAIQRLYAQALVLSGRAAEAKKILDQLPIQGNAAQQAAITGALARTVEFYITQGDWQSGEETWEKWNQQYPADFLEGYSVLLQTRLMELARYPQAAAKVAEAFALAMPRCSYSPRLLHRAGKLLEQSDPARSNALIELLKQKYPEDPLSQ